MGGRLDEIRGAVAQIRDQRSKLENAIELARRERDEITAAPLAKSDVLDVLLTHLDRLADDAPRALNFLFNQISTRPLADWEKHRQMLGDESQLPLLFGLLAPELRKALTAAVGARDEVEGAGPSIAERRRRIEKLDASISRDEAALDRLRADARAAGISLKSEAY